MPTTQIGYLVGDVLTTRNEDGGNERYWLITVSTGKSPVRVLDRAHAAIDLARASGSLGATSADDGHSATVVELVRRGA